jgi:hypothetical protein
MLAACGGDDSGDDDASGGATHAEALAALTQGSACAVASCHGTTAEADLDFATATDLRALLVNVKACEAPALNLVEPGQPDKSWLWLKLSADYDSASGDLKTQSAWGQPGNCPDAPGFGKRMPRLAPYKWTDQNLETIKSWIAGGAPGPT